MTGRAPGAPPIRRRRLALAVAAIAMVAAIGVPTPASAGRSPAAAPRADAAGPGLLGHDGRWLTDAQGRVVLLHGVNLVAKGMETPDGRGFGEDDAAFLAAQGFDVVRLGLSPDAFMPTPGVVDQDYLASFKGTVDTLTAHGLLVLVDIHQDGWGPTTSGNGFPDWMTFLHGAENTHTGFPLYYITNPAIQAAFDSFWANEKGPGGIGIQDQVAAMFKALAGAVGDNPNVIGYDTLNEPWPGTTWDPCLNDPDGCPVQDRDGLDPFNTRVDKAIRTEDPDHMVFGEPYVLFNFGQSITHIKLPGGDPQSGMSFHMYTTDVAKEPNVIKNAIDWSGRTGGALLASEFGANQDPAVVDRMVGEMDGALIPWMWWSYDENIVHDITQPPKGDNLVAPMVDALVRPHPVAVAGTPSKLSYERAKRALRFGWDTVSPSATTLSDGAETEIKVPSHVYGTQGYSVKVTGGTVTSEPDAAVLTIATDAGATTAFVKVWPKGDPEPPDEEVVEGVAPVGPVPTTVPPVADAPAATPVDSDARFTG